MNQSVWLAILSTSAWGVLNTLVAAWVIRRKTGAETKKLARESDTISQDTEDKIYQRLRAQLSDAVDRAGAAEQHANEAIARSNLQGARQMVLVKMFEKHVLWDRAVRDRLIQLGASESDIPMAPYFNPYEVLAADEKRIVEILQTIESTGNMIGH